MTNAIIHLQAINFTMYETRFFKLFQVLRNGCTTQWKEVGNVAGDAAFCFCKKLKNG